jgi:hypothetical protein
LLQAKVMFRKEFQSVDIDRAMQLSFDALGDLISAQEANQTFNSAEQTAIAKAKALERKDASLTIPAVGNVRGHCKTFMQKADHFAASLLAIVRLFYPDMKGNGWEDFHKMVKSQYGENDPFYKVTELTIPVLLLIRNARNCLDHHNLPGVKTSDFELLPDGTIAPPRSGAVLRSASRPAKSTSRWAVRRSRIQGGRGWPRRRSLIVTGERSTMPCSTIHSNNRPITPTK